MSSGGCGSGLWLRWWAALSKKTSPFEIASWSQVCGACAVKTSRRIHGAAMLKTKNLGPILMIWWWVSLMVVVESSGSHGRCAFTHISTSPPGPRQADPPGSCMGGTICQKAPIREMPGSLEWVSWRPAIKTFLSANCCWSTKAVPGYGVTPW